MVFDMQEYAVHKWRKGTPNNGVDPEAAAAYFEDLCETYGKVEPERVVEDARPADAMFHGSFEWSDIKAANRYRISQAQKLIGSLVRVTVVKSPDSDQHVEQVVRAFVNTSDGNHKAEYRPAVTAFNVAEYRANILDNAYREAKSYIAKYRTLKELAGVIPPLQDFVKDMEGNNGTDNS
jgi:hypothetical protein